MNQPTPELDADILALAAQWRQVVAESEKTYDETGEPDKSANDRMRAIEPELAALRAKTIAGVVSKLTPALSEDIDDTRHKLIEGAIADLERMVTAGVLGQAPAAADPAVALCEGWWKRQRAVAWFDRHPGGFLLGTPENDAREAEADAAVGRRDAVLRRLIAAPPTTVEGIAAVAEIVAVYMRLYVGDDAGKKTYDYERMMAAIRSRRHADDGTEIAAGGAA